MSSAEKANSVKRSTHPFFSVFRRNLLRNYHGSSSCSVTSKNNSAAQPESVKKASQRTISFSADSLSSDSNESVGSVSSSSNSGNCNSCQSQSQSSLSQPILCSDFFDITEDYTILPNIIGSGTYGTVKPCINKATNQLHAVKSIQKASIRKLTHLKREVELLSTLSDETNHHPNIMKMMNVYEDEEYVHIVTEHYKGGELYHMIVSRTTPYGCFSERNAAQIIKSLLEAVNHMHKRGIVHRDIKPENIMFESTLSFNSHNSSSSLSNIKLIDFGLATRFNVNSSKCCSTLMKEVVGTQSYQSPEILSGEGYDESCDIWSVGVIAYILLSGHPPFHQKRRLSWNSSSTSGIENLFKGPKWVYVSGEAKDFIKFLLCKDFKKRCKCAEEALDHAWIRENEL
jgi:calcium-dependent protein kinase